MGCGLSSEASAKQKGEGKKKSNKAKGSNNSKAAAEGKHDEGKKGVEGGKKGSKASNKDSQLGRKKASDLCPASLSASAVLPDGEEDMKKAKNSSPHLPAGGLPPATVPSSCEKEKEVKPVAAVMPDNQKKKKKEEEKGKPCCEKLNDDAEESSSPSSGFQMESFLVLKGNKLIANNNNSNPHQKVAEKKGPEGAVEEDKQRSVPGDESTIPTSIFPSTTTTTASVSDVSTGPQQLSVEVHELSAGFRFDVVAPRSTQAGATDDDDASNPFSTAIPGRNTNSQKQQQQRRHATVPATPKEQEPNKPTIRLPSQYRRVSDLAEFGFRPAARVAEEERLAAIRTPIKAELPTYKRISIGDWD